MSKSVIRATCSVAALAAAITASPTLAQAEPGEEAAGAEIVVTAQKREERIIDVPVSVNAVASEQIDRQRIYSLADLARSVPSVSSNGAIRGITTGGVARSSAGAVAVLLDGVDLGPPVVGGSQISNLFDIERIEVLSGPQGTLFGTTASAGVINVVSKAPVFNAFEVIGRAEIAEFGFHREQATVNVPLADTAALRVSGFNTENQGIVRNVFTGEVPENRARGVRGRLRWEPTSTLEVNLIGDYTLNTGNSHSNIAYAIAPAGSSLVTRLASCGIVASLDNRRNCAKGINPITSRREQYGFSGQIDLALGDHTLTSITAHRRTKLGDLGYNGLGGDSDFLAQNILDTNLTAEDLKITTQELRLTSPANQALEYTLGLYYFDKSQKDSVIQAGQLGDLGALIALLSGLPSGTVFGRVNRLNIDQRAYAAFGQATFHVNDQLSLIAGARYTEDKLTDVSTSLTPTTTPTIGSFGYAFTPLFFLAPVNEAIKVNNFSWKLGAQYEFSRDLMAYFTATRGYKGPAVNDQGGGTIIPIVQPEIPMAYELGMKGGFLSNRVFATLALFHNKVKDFQTSVYVPPSATLPAGDFAQGNAPYIKSRGVDFNVTARPTDELTLVGGVLYNKATYASNFVVACKQGSPAGCTTSPVPQLVGVPKWRFLINGEYAKEVAPGLALFTQADLTYESSRFAGTTPDPMLDIGGETTLNGRLGVRDPDRRWSASIFGQNLLGTDFTRITGDPLSGFNGGQSKSYWVAPARGATYGATFDFRF
jgi:iron complex outermembrane receptor protein